MSALTVEHPWVLFLLPLALVPPLVSLRGSLGHSWLALVPRDRLGSTLEAGLRALACLAIAAVVIALAGIRAGGEDSGKQADGASVMILLDRSRSMTEPFGTQAGAGDETTKAEAARRLLLDLLERAPEHRYGVVKFSTAPMLAVPPTTRTDMVRAGFRPLMTDGLTLTDLAGPFAMATDTLSRLGPGPRIVLLVTDGGAEVGDRQKHLLRRWLPRYGVDLLWLRPRSPGPPSVDKPLDPETSDAHRAPRELHTFFQSLPMPYSVFEVPGDEAVPELVAALEQHPTAPAPQAAGTGWRVPALAGLAFALTAGLALAAVRARQRRRW